MASTGSLGLAGSVIKFSRQKVSADVRRAGYHGGRKSGLELRFSVPTSAHCGRCGAPLSPREVRFRRPKQRECSSQRLYSEERVVFLIRLLESRFRSSVGEEMHVS